MEELEPMEVHNTTRTVPCGHGGSECVAAQHRTACYRHIIEQIELVKKILDNGYAYVSEGSVYFDVEKYNKAHHYGKLSGRNLEDVINNSRAWTAWERSITKWISLYGSVPSRNISCVGPVRGATVSPVGIASVRLWAASTWATISTSTVEEWT